MNANITDLDLTLDNISQAEEAVSCLLHSILLHRTQGKLSYRAEGNYSIGTVGLQDVDCKTMNSTYIRVSSDELISNIAKHCADLRVQLQGLPDQQSRYGSVVLQFYQKQRSTFGSKECKPWEIWNINVTLRPGYESDYFQSSKNLVNGVMSEKVISIVEAVSKHEFLPNMPVKGDLDLVYETSFTDIQPYLFKIAVSCSTDGSSSDRSKATVGSTVKRLLQDFNTT